VSRRIEARFAALRGAQRPALVTFVTAGEPEPARTPALLHALVEAGADLVELGVPFSDPMADGPVIQRASERALAKGVTLARTLELAQEFRAADARTPLVLMGYLNPIARMGYGEFARRAAVAGVDGVLTVDLPYDEDTHYHAALSDAGLAHVYLLAPTTSPERTAALLARAQGFVYYVSVRGVTGAARMDLAEVEARVCAARSHTALPIGVGFGVRDGETAARIGRFADAVIVGSAVIEALEEAAAAGADPLARAGARVRELAAALRQARAA
jgi:tryptophan synthase alpha chain